MMIISCTRHSSKCLNCITYVMIAPIFEVLIISFFGVLRRNWDLEKLELLHLATYFLLPSYLYIETSCWFQTLDLILILEIGSFFFLDLTFLSHDNEWLLLLTDFALNLYSEFIELRIKFKAAVLF